MMSNADHDSVRELYDGFGTHHSLARASILAGDPGYRRRATELLVTNYPIRETPASSAGSQSQEH